jgi:hypothetical protein
LPKSQKPYCSWLKISSFCKWSDNYCNSEWWIDATYEKQKKRTFVSNLCHNLCKGWCGWYVCVEQMGDTLQTDSK